MTDAQLYAICGACRLFADLAALDREDDDTP